MPATNQQIPLNPKAIVELGEKIYNEKFRAEYEAAHLGKFVAISVRSGKATLGTTPEEAFEQARKNEPSGVFHLIKVGSAGAFRTSYVSDADNDWL